MQTHRKADQKIFSSIGCPYSIDVRNGFQSGDKEPQLACAPQLARGGASGAGAIHAVFADGDALIHVL